MDYIKYVKEQFESILQFMNDNKSSFVSNPEKDFTRNRKLSFKDMIKYGVAMTGTTIQKGLDNYFGIKDSFDLTKSAYIQQNHKILPECFKFLFEEFTKKLEAKETYYGYHLKALDATCLNIPYDKNDTSTYIGQGSKRRGHNEIHVNTVYDIKNDIFTCCYIQDGKGNERDATLYMIKNKYLNKDDLVIADRGYEGFIVFAYLIENDIKFVIRLKEIGSTGILKNFEKTTEEFDIDYHKIFTNKTSKAYQGEEYKIFRKSNFEFLNKENHEYEMNFRIIRIKLPSGKYECIATNLSRAFSAKNIANLYQKRWKIETSYRTLKYSLNLNTIHHKNRESIKKEIYCRLIMFNFCETIYKNVIIKRKNKKYAYKSNRNECAQYCREYLKGTIVNLRKKLQKHLVASKKEKCHNPRNMKPQYFNNFTYRSN